METKKFQEQEENEFWLLFGVSAGIYAATWMIVFLLTSPYYLIAIGNPLVATDQAVKYASLTTLPWFVYRFIVFGKLLFGQGQKDSHP